MKKKIIYTVIILVIGAALLISSCTTTKTAHEKNIDLSYGHAGNVFGQQVITAAKDFSTLGLIFTEQTFKINVKDSFNGETFTYQALLKEANALGGDGIINVVIDHRIIVETEGETTTTTSMFGGAPVVERNGNAVRTEVWYGSALAIKYTTTLYEKSTLTTNQQNGVITSVTATETPILNGLSSSEPASPPASSPVSSSLGVDSSNSSSNNSGGAKSVGLFGSLRKN